MIATLSAYLVERFRPAVFVPAIALMVGLALCSAGRRSGHGSSPRHV